jgi:type IV secretory pathway VirB4 component
MWIAPFTCIISGPTGSGKSVFVRRLLKHAKTVIIPPPERVVYYYGIYQEAFTKMEGVEFREGLSSVEEEFGGRRHSLVVIDDLMSEANNTVSKLFTMGSHHTNTSVIFITQNFFNEAKEARNISLNAQYLVLYKNVRDQSQIGHLARQMYPRKSRHMVEAYIDATSSPHSYLFVDLKQGTDEKLRLKACIFPDDEYNYVYGPK